MDRQFWLERWRSGRIGFQRETANPYLLRYWDRVSAIGNAPVFVPLAGKTRDMRWLAERGHTVIGVELSNIAIRAFFDEWGAEAKVQGLDRLTAYTSDATTLYCGNFFDVEPTHIGGRVAVYDRASLIALPADMRERYAHHLLELLGLGRDLTGMLLVTLEYPQRQMEGPPFSVDEGEVRALFEPSLQVKRLCRDDVLQENERIRDKRVVALHECAYLLTPALPR